jgi:AcrR family transcriptional regulator
MRLPVSPSAKSPSEKSAPSESLREAKRLSILSAAAKIFNERGYHNTAMADVAEAIGVSKPFLYYYLKDKEDILYECARIATEQMHAMLLDVRKAEVTGWQRIEMAFRGYAEIMTTDFGVCLIRNSAPGSLPSKSREKLWAGRRRLNKEIEVFIAQGIADGSIRTSDPKTLSFALFGAFNWMAIWYRANGRLSPGTIADNFLDIVARGVVPPKAPTR